ncbi:MAG: Fic family protein [Bacteroidaceae bacterium]|nr:Fic family protein [Bacteroidaceae bacterium]
MKNYISGTYLNQGYYVSFQPTLINKVWDVSDLSLLSLLSKADRTIGRLDMFSDYVPNVDLFISMHIVKEAIKSSSIEGTQTNIEEALMDKEDLSKEKRDDWTEVQNYIQAMNTAIKSLQKIPLSSRLLREVHKTLMSGVRGLHKQPGEFRRSQNWIGGTRPDNAVYVPPAHTEIPSLINDMEQFIHNPACDLPDLIKAALLHYQFEAIHPFNDGNGRTGRLLITLYLVSKGVISRPILYLSDFFEKHRSLYYEKIRSVQQLNDMTGWVKFFLEGVIETANNGTETLNKVLTLKQSYGEIVKTMGSKSANGLKLLDYLYQHPFVDTKQVASILSVSFPSASTLLKEMQGKGMLSEITGAQRGKKYVLKQYLQAYIS